MNNTDKYNEDKQLMKQAEITEKQRETLNNIIDNMNSHEAKKAINLLKGVQRNNTNINNKEELWNRIAPGSIIKTNIGTEYLACLVIEKLNGKNKELYVSPFHTFNDKYEMDVYIMGRKTTTTNKPNASKYVILEENHFIFKEPHDTYLDMKMANEKYSDDSGIRKISLVDKNYKVLDKTKVLDRQIINDIIDFCIPNCKELIYPERKYIRRLEIENSMLKDENQQLNNKNIKMKNNYVKEKIEAKELEENNKMIKEQLEKITQKSKDLELKMRLREDEINSINDELIIARKQLGVAFAIMEKYNISTNSFSALKKDVVENLSTDKARKEFEEDVREKISLIKDNDIKQKENEEEKEELC